MAYRLCLRQLYTFYQLKMVNVKIVCPNLTKFSKHLDVLKQLITNILKIIFDNLLYKKFEITLENLCVSF